MCLLLAAAAACRLPPAALPCSRPRRPHAACLAPCHTQPPQVEFPDGRSTLCLLPAKFHKKLWVRKGSFLVVEDAPAAGEEGSRVTGQIVAVLYADHVKQLRRMPGVW